MHNVDQNLFLHDTVMIPFEILDNNEFELAQIDDDIEVLPAMRA